MSRAGRGSTGPGRAAALPDAGYQPDSAVLNGANGNLRVAFHGDDGRQATFDLSRLPLPGWHEVLAAAFAERTGPSGGIRTRSAADGKWGSLGRLVRFLATLPDAPVTPDRLRASHLEAYHQHRAARTPKTAVYDVSEFRLLFAMSALRQVLSAEVVDYVQRRLPQPREQQRGSSTPLGKRLTVGFSDAELDRLLAALRHDVAAIRDRIRAGESLLRHYEADPSVLSGPEQELGKSLAHMASTGQVDTPPGVAFSGQRSEMAGHLFLRKQDLLPLMMLATAVMERNGETVKELPATYRVLENKAVEVVIVKRRRGRQRWFETVTWEIGELGRELHNPGGLYLLLLELTARSRAFAGSPLMFCVWRSGVAARLDTGDDHLCPFAQALGNSAILPARWAANRRPPVSADAVADETVTKPLQVSFNRIRTSMEVRRTKRMGGHLPSAAKSNSMPVLFRHYLSGDPVITAWAQEVLGEALLDAEQSALAAHHRALTSTGGELRVVPGPVDPQTLQQHAQIDAAAAGQAVAGQLDTGWTACVDHQHHPLTGAACQVTFLDCFHCGNCLVTRDHLPRLLGLLDALSQRRQQLSGDDWWSRYGPAWAAIRHDILAKFSTAEIAAAQATKPIDAILDLVENPWEHS